MSVIDDVSRSIGRRINDESERDVRMVPAVVSTLAPLTVSIEGSPVSVPATWMSGHFADVGDPVMALWWPGRVSPVVFTVDTPSAVVYETLRAADGNFAASAFASAASLSLPSDAPAGMYNVDWFTLIQSTSTAFLFIRGLIGATNSTSDLPVTLPANTRVSTNIPVSFVHTGGAISLALQVQVSAGTGTAFTGCRIRATRVGSA